MKTRLKTATVRTNNLKQTEAALRESEERLRLALDAARMGTFDWNVPNNHITWSRWHEELWGFKPGEFGGTYEAFSERVHPEDLPGVNAEVARCVAAREQFSLGFRVVWPDGSVRWVQARGEFMFGEDVQPLRMRGTVVDITERKQTEEKLARLNQQYELILGSSAEGIVGLDLEGRHTFVNPIAAKMLGYQAGELLGGPSHSKWHHTKPDGTPYPREECAIYAAFRDGKVHRSSTEVFWRKDGTSFPVEYASTPIYEHGRLAGAVVTFSDITERQRMEQALRHSEDDYRQLFQNNPQPMWAYDPETLAFLAVNDAAVKHYGYSRDEFLAMTIKDIRPPEDIPSLVEEMENLPAGLNDPKVWRHSKKDGTIIFTEISSHSSVFAGKQARIILANDLTESMRAENERRIVFEIIQGVISTPNLDEFLRLVHRSISQIVYAENCFVMLRDPVNDMNHFEFWVDKYDPPPAPHLAGKGFSSYVLRTGKPLLITEESREKIIKAGGAEQIGSYSPSWLGVPLRTPSGTIGALVLQHYEDEHAYTERDLEFLSSVGDEIALAIERKRAEDALTESEERYRDLVENAIDVIYAHDLDGNYTSVNKAVETVSGYTREETLTMNIAQFAAPDYLEKAKQMMAAKLAGKDVTTYELEIIAKDGRRVAVEINSRIIYENGAAVGVQGIARDITERKRTEEAISTLRRELELTMSSMEEGVHRVDINGIIVFENPAAVRMLGWEIDQLLGKPAHLTMHHTRPDGTPYPIDECPIYATFRDGVSRQVADEVFWRRDGTSFPVEYMTAPMRNDQNEIVAAVVTFRDITERKRAKDALKLFRELVDQSNDTIEVVDPETGRFLDINEKGCINAGYSREEFLALSVFDVDPTVNQSAFRGIVEELRKSGLLMWEGIRRRKDGSTFPVEVNIKYVRLDRDYLVAVVRDITQRKGAEEQLRLHAIALEAAANAIIITDRDGTIAWVNPAFTDVTGYALDEVLGQNPRILKSGELDAAYYKTLWDTILSGRAWQGEMINRRKDGTTYYEEQTITPVMDESGEIINFIAIKQDVTERRRAKEALIESEERYRDLVENAIDLIYTHDLKGNYTSANKAAETILGYSVDEALKMNLAETVAPEYLEKARQMIADKLAGKEITAYELEVFAKDGHRVAIEVNSRIIYDNGVPVGIQGVARDITARKHLEEQFLQSQKMEGIGMLAGGIAHDFNNLLTAILGFSDLTLKRMPADDPFRRNIEEIKDAGQRAAALTGQLLAFSRKQILKPTVHNVNTVIENQERMLRRIIRENIELKTVLDPELGNINADPVQIEQVIMNLAVNARDAMPEGGRLTIETQDVYLDDKNADRIFNLDPGPYVRMIVTDTGQGMDEQTRRRIFEPFFTTKDVGKGTGLGLSTAHGIVTQSGGDILVYSEIGHGTTFKIYLPCVDENIQKPKWIGDDEENYSGTETILLVEDQDIVRTLVCEILTGNGYRVVEANSGEAALSVCDNYTEPIHMLLTDLIMPGMSGLELRDQLVKLLPDLKILIMSGYTDDSIGNSGILDSDSPFIEKPFTPDGLARKVREVLES